MYEQFLFFFSGHFIFYFTVFLFLLKRWFPPFCLIKLKAVSLKVDPKQCYLFTLRMHYFDCALYIDHGLLFENMHVAWSSGIIVSKSVEGF